MVVHPLPASPWQLLIWCKKPRLQSSNGRYLLLLIPPARRALSAWIMNDNRPYFGRHVVCFALHFMNASFTSHKFRTFAKSSAYSSGSVNAMCCAGTRSLYHIKMLCSVDCYIAFSNKPSPLYANMLLARLRANCW